MDPVTGIGLAASVIQLIQFGISTAKTCHELYEKGSTSEHEDLKFNADHLESLANTLQQSLQQASPAQSSLSLRGPEQDLTDLAKKCEDCAIDLQHELRKYQSSPQQSRFRAAGKSFRHLIKGDKIGKLQERLEQYQKTLETSLLFRLR